MAYPTTTTGLLSSARTRRNIALAVTILLMLLSYAALQMAELPRTNFIAQHYDEINWQRFLPAVPKPIPVTETPEQRPEETAKNNAPEFAEAPRVPPRLDLAAELQALDADLKKFDLKPETPRVAARGAETKNSPAPLRETMPSLTDSDFPVNLNYDVTNLESRLPAGAQGRRSGNEKGNDIRVGTGGSAPIGGGLSNAAIAADAGLGVPNRDNTERGKSGGEASVKIDLKGLNDFGDNYRNFTPIYRALVEWMRRHPADLPEVVDRFMGFQAGNLTSRAVFNIGGRRYEMLLLCVEATYEVRVVLIDGSEVIYLIDEGFKKQSNYLRLGSLTRQTGGEIVRFGSVMREASDRRTQDFYQIFLSWWDTVKHEVE